MIRRFNYTGKRRIEINRVRIELREQPGRRHCFEAHLNLKGLNLPLDSLVTIEAYRQSTYMRFGFGTVGRFDHCSDTELTEFFDPSAVLFRVKVISVAGEKGLLLAEAEGLHPREPDDSLDSRRPLLPVCTGDLGGEAWNLDLEGDPILRIDRRLGEPRIASRQPAFISLVYPEAMRQILREALRRGGEADEDDGWWNDWIRFARQNLGAPEPPEVDIEVERERWIEVAVRRFCRHHRILDRYLSDVGGADA